MFSFPFSFWSCSGRQRLPGAAWSGNWDTTYGQLRLMQDGRRVYGDYAARGTIEGTVSEAGDELRAVFMYTDGRWGLVRWTRAGNRISGLWNWSASGIPSKGAGTRWDGKRTSRSADPASLRRIRTHCLARG